MRDVVGNVLEELDVEPVEVEDLKYTIAKSISEAKRISYWVYEAVQQDSNILIERSSFVTELDCRMFKLPKFDVDEYISEGMEKHYE